jgi:hypothetical protein
MRPDLVSSASGSSHKSRCIRAALPIAARGLGSDTSHGHPAPSAAPASMCRSGENPNEYVP